MSASGNTGAPVASEVCKQQLQEESSYPFSGIIKGGKCSPFVSRQMKMT